MRRRCLALAAGLAAVLLAGCGPDKSTTTDTAPPAPAGTTTSSPAATSASGALQAGKDATCPAESMVSQTLGVNIKAPTAIGNGGIAVCTYDPVDIKADPAPVFMRLSTEAGASEFTNAKGVSKGQGYATTDQSGIGDGAFSFKSTERLTNMWAYKGRVLVFVTSSASLEKITALVKALLG